MDREVSEPRTRSVPVHGGDLAVAEWGPADGPILLAIHGITASSRAWQALARQLPEVHLVAPDLRGRGRSAGLPGPFGLERHRADLQRVLDDLGGDPAVAVGHSMGAFVALLLAAAEPGRVAELVLVDGGVPLAPPEGHDPEQLLALSPAALLGPAFERLTRVFPSRDDYDAFWRAHPAFAGAWSEDIAAYAAYDLEPADGGFRPSANPEAVAADQRQLFGPAWYRDAMRRVRQPTTALRARLGLQAEPPGLYAPGALESFRADLPQLRVIEVPDVNHYTILMSRPGAEAVASTVLGATARTSP
jgi:pimeloyl-ACP methyl ester carboxylesterase